MPPPHSEWLRRCPPDLRNDPALPPARRHATGHSRHAPASLSTPVGPCRPAHWRKLPRRRSSSTDLRRPPLADPRQLTATKPHIDADHAHDPCPYYTTTLHYTTLYTPRLAGRHVYGRPAPAWRQGSTQLSAGRLGGQCVKSRNPTLTTLPPRRSHLRQAGAYARRHGLVLAALLDAWLPRSRTVSRRPRATPASGGGGGGANVSRGASVATRPATSAGLGAHGPEQPRTLSVTEGQVTSRQI